MAAPYIGMENIKNLEPAERFNHLNDYLFYKVMGVKGNEIQLLGFLNAVLGRTGKKLIKDVEIQDNNFIAADMINGKSCFLDIQAILEDGTKVNIEVQLRNENNMDRRSLFYWSKLYSESLDKGDNYQELPNVIAINILDFDYPLGGCFHTCFNLREATEPDLILTPALEIHFINMVKWRRISDRDLENIPLHRWLTWFDPKSPLELVEEVASMDRAIKAAEERRNFVAQSWEERDLYRRRQKAIMDYNSGMNSARREGKEEGRAEIIALLRQGATLEEIEERVRLVCGGSW